MYWIYNYNILGVNDIEAINSAIYFPENNINELTLEQRLKINIVSI